MKKLYQFKNWYSLEDAAKRIAITLGEDVSVNDVLQMTVEGHLPLSWYMRHVAAQPVAPYTHIWNWDRTLFGLPKSFYNTPEAREGFLSVLPYAENGPQRESGVLIVMPSLKVLSDEVEYLDGPYTLDLEICGAIKDWVISLITKTGGELISLDGYFVRDNTGVLWRVMERFTKEELEAKKKASNLPPAPTLPGWKKPFNHYDYFYPSGGSPDPADLGITKNDLERFEALLTNTALSDGTQERPLKTRERETALKLIVGMAAAWYGYKPKASKNTAASEIASDLQRVGIAISDDTVRKWLNEAAEFLPPDAQKS